MNELKLYNTEITANDGTPVRFVYDRETDILEIFFGENESATGVELTEHIILRFSGIKNRAVSLTVLHFSILSERTEYGQRSYPLSALEEFPESLREDILQIISSMPVSQFLKISYFQASSSDQIPFTYLEPQAIAAIA